MIEIEGYKFEGPYQTATSVKDISGAYVIHYLRDDGKYERLDAGESEKLRSRLENHERQQCWISHARGSITYSVLYCSAENRVNIADRIRLASNLPCGER
jgi:hypothetical protein